MKIKVLYLDGKEQVVECDELDFGNDVIKLQNSRTMEEVTTKKFWLWSTTTKKNVKKIWTVGLIRTSLVASALMEKGE